MDRIFIILLISASLILACKNSQKSEDTAPMQKVEANTIVVEQFVDKTGKTLSVKYDTSAEKPAATITYLNFKGQVLTQTEAWAKGASYTDGDITWTTTETGGNLEVDGQVFAFKSK